MNQKQLLLSLFNMYGGKLTLGQLLAHPSGVGYKAASRFADLRKEGHEIECILGPTASENTYILKSWGKDGQGSLGL